MNFSVVADIAGKNCWADSNYVWKKIVENSEVLVLLLLLLAVNTESCSIVCTKLWSCNENKAVVLY